MTEFVDPRTLSWEEILACLAESARERAARDARDIDLINALDEKAQRSGFELDKDFVCEDIAVTLRISSGSAAEQLWVARELARMPRLLELLRRGEMNAQHAGGGAADPAARRRTGCGVRRPST